MTVESLELVGIGIDDAARLLAFALTSEVPRGFHVALAATLAGTELTIAGNDFVGTSHLVILR